MKSEEEEEEKEERKREKKEEKCEGFYIPVEEWSSGPLETNPKKQDGPQARAKNVEADGRGGE